jgi:hypothetical protein
MFVPHDAEFFIISPVGHGTTKPVMGIRNYMGAWMILDNYPWALVYAFEGAHLRQVRMSNHEFWWRRDLAFIPSSRGPMQ